MYTKDREICYISSSSTKDGRAETYPILHPPAIMKKNMGTADRAIRVIVALVVAYLIYAGTLSGTWAIVAGIAAAVFVLTSVVSFCPLYAPFGMSTCKTRPNNA